METSGSTLDLIAAFIDGTIDDAERSELLAVLADDEDAYEVFVGAIEFLRVEAERKATNRRKRPLIAIAVLLAIASTVLLFVWWST